MLHQIVFLQTLPDGKLDSFVCNTIGVESYEEHFQRLSNNPNVKIIWAGVVVEQLYPVVNPYPDAAPASGETP